MLVSAAWMGPAILGAINVVAQQRLSGGAPARASDMLFASGDWLLYAFLTPAVFVIARRWPLSRPHLARRVAQHTATAVLFCAAWAAGGTLLRALVMRRWDTNAAQRYFASWFFITLPFGVAVYFAVVGIEHAIRYFVEARERDTQVARLSAQLSSARYAALQAQLNPHFMFNTLNTIAVLVRDGERTAATAIVEQFSDVLRRTLRRDRANEVTLEEEMELVTQYVAIEQARFSDRLRPTLKIDASVFDAAVPSFSVQHLVENAIRHGIARQSTSGRVSVSARRDRDILEISIGDDGPGFDLLAAVPAGHGIESLRERLTALYGGRASVVITCGADGTVATLRLPYRVMLKDGHEER